MGFYKHGLLNIQTLGLGELDIDQFNIYMHKYVQMLKTFGKLIEIGFSDIDVKCQILKENQAKLAEKGEKVETLEQLLETEIKLGLGNVNGSNNKKKGFDKKSEYYTHIGSCRSAERLLRFMLLLLRIIQNMESNREESFSVCVRNAYDKELSRYHSFFLRNTVKGIFYLLPSRESFLINITNDWKDCNEEELYEMIKELIGNLEQATDYLTKFLKDRDHFELE